MTYRSVMALAASARCQNTAMAIFDYRLPARCLIGSLIIYMVLSQVLLWRFLGVMPTWAYVGTATLVAICAAIFWRDIKADTSSRLLPYEPKLGVLLASLAISVCLFILGGEGRLVYANMDWQVRDAVLRDLAIHPWPFAYTARVEPDLLRAPIGMYLLPALAFKWLGPVAGDWALLIQNSVLLAVILTLASTLFVTRHGKSLAAAIFIGFSGLDAIGELFVGKFNEHMESWANIQFSSTITLGFWAPQHALMGWLGAVLFLLWRAGKLPLMPMLTLLPLTALWSPLALMGSLVFALFAGAATAWRRQLATADIIVPAGACALALPSLLYLAAASSTVGLQLYPIGPWKYLLFEAVEILPFLIPLGWAAGRGKTDLATFMVTAGSLLLAPLFQIGWSSDLTMRASIPALAILSVLVAQFLLNPATRSDGRTRSWLVVMLCIGAMTGASEVNRALSHGASPRGRCSVFGAIDNSFAPGPKNTYVAPVSQMPLLVRPKRPALIPPDNSTLCWSRPWYRPTGI